MAADSAFHFDSEKSTDHLQLPLTTIKCHGKLTVGSAAELKNFVQPLIDAGGHHIVIDCSDLQLVDSSGLGTLVGLKVSAINKGLVHLELVNLSSRVAELLKLTRLTELLTR
jgi:anti-sigma B factor antagonist